jgi:hypothetical protein
MPNDYRTMGQGMGFGMRPDYAGGLGLLYDKSGNDKYIGGVYAQGVGYWYATGILIDESGNDVYNAIYYPQGSGIHLASGILYDGAGDDTYYSRNGPGQGAGHDWALACWWMRVAMMPIPFMAAMAWGSVTRWESSSTKA